MLDTMYGECRKAYPYVNKNKWLETSKIEKPWKVHKRAETIMFGTHW